MSNNYVQRRVQKLASAVKVLFTEGALLEDRSQFLSKINNAAEVRQSTESLVLVIVKTMDTRTLSGKEKLYC
jgi:hypothetical protein